MTPVCNMLWIGPSLGALERACMRSVLRHHPLDLYCYAPPAGLPEGITLRDADEIVPEHQIVRHRRSGSVSLFSNRFRYELQRRGRGTWLDCDAYLLKPLDQDASYLLCEFEPGRVTPGVLRAPADSPLVAALLEVFEETSVPSWIPARSRAAARWRLWTTGKAGLSHMPWGSAGPLALTHFARQFGLLDLAAPAALFHPLRWEEAERVRREPLESLITPDSVSIHLWNERIKWFKDIPAPVGTFLAQVQEEGRA